ncbi:MAG: hypothetical protein JWN75_835 [Candidatus Saccharibacteria bacterium]|nr:hypothetical protein [Candidatus Saccharibacteria bacterium]
MEYIARIVRYFQLHRKTIIIIVFLGVLLGLGTNAFLNYAVVELSVAAPSSVNSRDVQVYANHDTESTLIGSSGISIIPRNTRSLTVTTKNQQMRTITALAIPWYGIAFEHTTLTNDLNADKVAFRSSRYNTCASYNAAADRLLAFACSGNSGLTYYDTTSKEWVNNLITTIGISGQVTAYRGGVIGLSSINNSDSSSRPAPIEYISPNGTRHHYAFPDNFVEYDDFSQISIVTDQTDPSNSHFILTTEGIVYLASIDANDNVSYITIPAPSSYNVTKNQTICTFKNVYVYCYRGIIAADDTVSQSSSFQPTIIQASFDNSNTRSFTTNIQIMDTLYSTTSGLLFSKNYKSLSYLKKIGDTYTSQQISDTVDDAQVDAGIYFIDNTGVLTYNTTTATSTQVFRSANVSPKHLITSGGKVFILGYVADDSSYTYTYAWALNNETDTNYGKRLIDTLPSFLTSASDLYGDTDLVGKTVNVTVPYDRAAGTTSIHQKKQATLDYLKSIGVNTSEVTLTNP